MTDCLKADYTAIGVMSGTSMDAIDVALIESDGDTNIRIGASTVYHYPAETRTELLELIGHPERIERADLSDIERAVTIAHCQAVENFLHNHRLDIGSIDLIGFHGQTILHRPELRLTKQLFDGDYAANRLQKNCVARFRNRDVEAGGQGAPLAPLYHQARASTLKKPLAILNLGGVANITLISESEILAFDTGPASALMDDMMRKQHGLDFDKDGAIAQSGTIDQVVLKEILTDPYFSKTPPKSLDRNDFHRWMKRVEQLDFADAMATLAAFTVESIAKARDYCNSPPEIWLVGGGGRRNAFLMNLLRTHLQASVEPVETVGWNGDMLEAECFAWLAIRTVKGLPLSLPSTTGVPEPMTGGVLYPFNPGLSS